MSETATQPATVATLAPIILVRAEIVASNFAEVREVIRESLEELNLEPSNDEEFNTADKDAKGIKALEKALAAAKSEALAKAADVQALFVEIDDACDELRTARLKLEKAVKTKKAELVEEIVQSALDSIEAKNKSPYRNTIAGAVKGKRSLETMRIAAEAMAAIVNETLGVNRAMIDAAIADHGKGIALGADALEVMSADALRIELDRRAENLDAAKEKERLEKELADEKAKEEERSKAEEVDAPPVIPQAIPGTRTGGKQPDPMFAAEPDNAPTPKAEAPAPGSPRSQDFAKLELDAYLGTVRITLAPLKVARERLQFPENTAAALKFATTINAAYKELKGGSK